MDNTQLYNVTIGLNVTKAESPAYADFGLRYSNMPYDHMVQVEAVMAKYAAGINEALAPVIEELVQLGYAKAEEKKTIAEAGVKYPGAIR